MCSWVPGEEDEKPRNILEEIVWFKNEEIARHREKMDLVSLKRKMNFTPPARDFIGAIKAIVGAVGLVRAFG